MVEDASGDVAAEDARDVNTQLQVEMIKQQRKTNALLRARAQTVSASLAPARTRTRLVQQQQHHALRWQPSEERDPADHRAQPGKVKYAETGFSDTVPTRLTKCGRLDSNWHWNPCSYPSSPESLPRLDYTPPLPRQARNHRGLSKLNVWVAHMRIALSYNNANT